MKRLAIVLLLGAGCASAPLVPGAMLREGRCTGVGRPGRAEIQCRLDDSAAVKRLRVLSLEGKAIVLVAEEAPGPRRNVPGIDQPLSVAGLGPGLHQIVLRGSDGEVVLAGSVDVQPLPRLEEMDEAALEVYGPATGGASGSY